jgi:hypothetical protein
VINLNGSSTLLCGLSGTASVTLVKAVNASGRIDQLLLAGKERVAGRANFYVKFFAHGRTRLKAAAAGTCDRDLVVIRMYILFHDLFLFAVYKRCVGLRNP